MPSYSKWLPRNSMAPASLPMTQLQHTNVGNNTTSKWTFQSYSLFLCQCSVFHVCPKPDILFVWLCNPPHLHKTLWVILRGTKGRFWITYSLVSVNQTIHKFYLINTEDFFSSILWFQDFAIIILKMLAWIYSWTLYVFIPILVLVRKWSSSPLVIFILLFSLLSLCLYIFRKQSKLPSAFSLLC